MTKNEQVYEPEPSTLSMLVGDHEWYEWTRISHNLLTTPMQENNPHEASL